MTVYHVRPRDDGQWEVKKRGASRASFVGGEVKAKSGQVQFVFCHGLPYCVQQQITNGD